jgi:hypothetical protein
MSRSLESDVSGPLSVVSRMWSVIQGDLLWIRGALCPDT